MQYIKQSIQYFQFETDFQILNFDDEKKLYKLSKLGGEVIWTKSKRTAVFFQDVVPYKGNFFSGTPCIAPDNFQVDWDLILECLPWSQVGTVQSSHLFLGSVVQHLRSKLFAGNVFSTLITMVLVPHLDYDSCFPQVQGLRRNHESVEQSMPKPKN